MENLNIFGEKLKTCSKTPLTGFFRDGYCSTGKNDIGSHTVCAVVTQEFLEFSYLKGNDLITARPTYQFSGLVPGDRWCLCASRWLEAYQAGKAPFVDLEATNEKALEVIPREILLKFAVKNEIS